MRTAIKILTIMVLFALAPSRGVYAQNASSPSVSAGQSATVRFDFLVAEAKAAMLVDPTKVIDKAIEAQAAAQTLTGRARILGVATTEWLRGEAYIRLNDPAKAKPLIDSALAAVSNGPVTKLTGDILLSRGGLHTATANVAGALADYQRAHNVFRDIGETRSRAVALLSIALLYQEANDYENALRYTNQARDIYRGDPQLLLAIYNNRGVCLIGLDRFSDAEAQYREALALAKMMKSPLSEAQVLRNLARAQLSAGKLATADRTIAEEMAVGQRAGVPADAQDWGLLACAALLRGDVRGASALVARTFAGVDLHNTTLAFREAHQAAYDLFKKTSKQQQALAHLEALKRLDDQTSKLAASTNTALMAARFDFANQELRIAKLKADELQRNIEYERSRARTQRFIFAGVAVATIIIISMLAFGLVTIRRSRNEVRAANIDLEATNAALGKALAAKTEFLATTSHEIRTPLNGILGMTQVMLADSKIDAATRDRLEVVNSAGVTMRALVDDILDVAKMETGNMTIEQAPMDLRTTLTDVSRMWDEQAQGRGIGFTLDLAHSPHWVTGDPARLRQVVFNLLSNALKFTEQGSVGVRCTAVGDRLRVAVSDTGIGIPPDKLDIIFESFKQADGGTTRKFGGTGLGLAICRNLARAMGGDVLVDSRDGQGATFTLDLPLVAAQAPEAPCSNHDPDNPCALVILDRNPISRAMLRTVLEPRAGAVILAATPDDAIESLRSGKAAMLLIDDNAIRTLPEPRAVLRDLAAHAHAADCTIALLWAAPDEHDNAAFEAAGIDQIVVKPLAGVALAEALFPTNRDASKMGHLVSDAA